MRKAALMFALLCVVATAALAQELSPFKPPKTDKVPPSDIYAADALKNSPRHGEMIDIKLPDGQMIKSWIVYPQASGKVGVVIVIHEIFGLTDWVRGVADQVAKDGFIAIAPDLISGFGPGGGGTAEVIAAGGQPTTVINQVKPSIQVDRLNAVMAYGKSLPSSNGKTGTVGFCWGGSASFNYATAQPALAAAVVFYGTAPTKLVDGKQAPDPDLLGKINAPVIGFYPSLDNRTASSVEPTAAAMKAAGKSYESHILDGASHGFMREQGKTEALADYKAAEQAWPAVIKFFQARLK